MGILLLASTAWADQLIYDCNFSIESPKDSKAVISRRFLNNQPVQVTLRDYTFVVQGATRDGGPAVQLRILDACGDGSETTVPVGYAHPALTFHLGSTVAESECQYKPDGHW